MPRSKNLILLLLILIFALALRLIFFTGIDSSDSIGYAKTASDIEKGKPLTESVGVGALRLGIVYPVSILYKIFGVSEFSSNILALLASLAFIVLVYKLGKLVFNEKIGLLAAFFLSFFPFDVINSTRLNTDATSAFFATLCIYFFLKAEKSGSKTKHRFAYFFSGISLGAAYLIKELSLLIGLFFLAYAVYTKKIKIDYFLIALGFILMFSIELLYFLNLTGNPFYRHSYINSDYAAKIVIENQMQGRSDFPEGFFHYPYLIFSDKLLGIFYPFIFIAIVYAIANRKKEAYEMLLWFIPVLLYVNFGSLSLAKYVPVPTSVRFLSLITAPGLALLAYFLSQNENLIKKIMKPSIVLLLLLTSIGYIHASGERFSLDDERGSFEYLSLKDRPIYTDEKTAAVFSYLSGYKSNGNIKPFHYYDPLKPENSYALELGNVKDAYVVINHEIIEFLVLSKKDVKLPKEIFSIPKNWVIEKEIKSGKNKIEIYYAP